jgi:flavin reductase (DIM6/NTAB) family NADH-FMN oxidoreductase RutF
MKREHVRLPGTLPTLPLPLCLLGSVVDGKPNFCTVAWFTMIDDEPSLVGLLLGKKRRTRDGIAEHGCFGVSIVGKDMAMEADRCGMVSGYDRDKSDFLEVRYGELRHAPMAAKSPLAMECVLEREVEFAGTDLIVGRVKAVHCDRKCVRDGRPDLKLMDPLLYSMPGGPYYSLGDKVADAFQADVDGTQR